MPAVLAGRDSRRAESFARRQQDFRQQPADRQGHGECRQHRHRRERDSVGAAGSGKRRRPAGARCRWRRPTRTSRERHRQSRSRRRHQSDATKNRAPSCRSDRAGGEGRAVLRDSRCRRSRPQDGCSAADCGQCVPNGQPNDSARRGKPRPGGKERGAVHEPDQGRARTCSARQYRSRTPPRSVHARPDEPAAQRWSRSPPLMATSSPARHNAAAPTVINSKSTGTTDARDRRGGAEWPRPRIATSRPRPTSRARTASIPGPDHRHDGQDEHDAGEQRDAEAASTRHHERSSPTRGVGANRQAAGDEEEQLDLREAAPPEHEVGDRMRRRIVHRPHQFGHRLRHVSRGGVQRDAGDDAR